MAEVKSINTEFYMPSLSVRAFLHSTEAKYQEPIFQTLGKNRMKEFSLSFQDTSFFLFCRGRLHFFVSELTLT